MSDVQDVLAQTIRVGFVTARQPEKMRVQVELRDTVTQPLRMAAGTLSAGLRRSGL